jgi:hypothetical protein
VKPEDLKKTLLEELELIAKGLSFRSIVIRSDSTFKLKNPYSAKKAKALLKKIKTKDK